MLYMPIPFLHACRCHLRPLGRLRPLGCRWEHADHYDVTQAWRSSLGVETEGPPRRRPRVASVGRMRVYVSTKKILA